MSLNSDLIKEEGDKKGRYVLVKGKLDSVLVAFACIYAPLESDKKVFTQLFEKIGTFSEGI